MSIKCMHKFQAVAVGSNFKRRWKESFLLLPQLGPQLFLSRMSAASAIQDVLGLTQLDSSRSTESGISLFASLWAEFFICIFGVPGWLLISASGMRQHSPIILAGLIPSFEEVLSGMSWLQVFELLLSPLICIQKFILLMLLRHLYMILVCGLFSSYFPLWITSTYQTAVPSLRSQFNPSMVAP